MEIDLKFPLCTRNSNPCATERCSRGPSHPMTFAGWNRAEQDKHCFTPITTLGMYIHSWLPSVVGTCRPPSGLVKRAKTMANILISNSPLCLWENSELSNSSVTWNPGLNEQNVGSARRSVKLRRGLQGREGCRKSSQRERHGGLKHGACRSRRFKGLCRAQKKDPEASRVFLTSCFPQKTRRSYACHRDSAGSSNQFYTQLQLGPLLGRSMMYKFVYFHTAPLVSTLTPPGQQTRPGRPSS